MTANETAEPVIDVHQSVAAPVAIVWRALTESELLARWWAPNTLVAESGNEFVMEMPGWGNVACTVLVVEPEQHFGHTFGDWTIAWTLSSTSDGTDVSLVHAGFDLEKPQDQFAYENMAAGWVDTVLPRLAALCESLV